MGQLSLHTFVIRIVNAHFHCGSCKNYWGHGTSIVTSIATTSAATAEAAASTSVLTTLGDVNLDGLPVDACPVELPHSGLGGIFVHHGDESVALAGVVDIGNFTASAELALQDVPGAPLVDPVHEELRHHADLAAFSNFKSLAKFPSH